MLIVSKVEEHFLGFRIPHGVIWIRWSRMNEVPSTVISLHGYDTRIFLLFISLFRRFSWGIIVWQEIVIQRNCMKRAINCTDKYRYFVLLEMVISCNRQYRLPYLRIPCENVWHSIALAVAFPRLFSSPPPPEFFKCFVGVCQCLWSHMYSQDRSVKPGFSVADFSYTLCSGSEWYWFI